MNELRLYCLMRGDLSLYTMVATEDAPVRLHTDAEIEGKLMVQAGHAFVNALEEARRGDWVQDDIDDSARLLLGSLRVREYLTVSQPKIVLKAKNEAALRRAADECRQARIPHYLVTDEGRTVFPEPTVTCLGIGPVLRQNLPKFIDRMQMW